MIKGFFKNLVGGNEPNSRVWVPRRHAGVHVDHDSAMTLSSVFDCVRLISEDVAKLPWNVFRQLPDGRKEKVSGSRIGRLLSERPNPEMTAFSFRETLVAWALTWGNGYAEIQRDISNRPINLWLLAPNRVEPKRDDRGVYYEVSNESGPKTVIMQADMLHLHGLGFDGILGYSVISYAARTIGAGIATEVFGESFFGNNTIIGGYIKHPKALSDTAFGRLKDWLGKKNGPKKAFEPEILEEGMEWVSNGIPPEDAQFIETKKFTVNDVARWFRVPPHKIGDLERATFSNIEEQEISYVNDTLVPWITRLEQEVSYKLITPRSGIDFTKLNQNALLRGSFAARSEFYREMRNMGVFSVNEIREKEDMNPIGPEGDKRIVQMNMTTLEKIGEDEVPRETPEIEAKQVHYSLIAKALTGIYVREQRRFNGFAGNSDESAFIDSVNDFLNGEHKMWVQDILAESLAIVMNDLEVYDIDYAIINYIDRHILTSRNRAIRIFRGIEIDIDEQALSESKGLIDSVIQDHEIKSLIHDKV